MSFFDLPPDPYEALGVARDAEVEAIRKAHRKLVIRYHPDRIKDPNLVEESLEKFHKIQQAYEILGDPLHRERYDEKVKLAELRQQRLRYEQAEQQESQNQLSPTFAEYLKRRSVQPKRPVRPKSAEQLQRPVRFERPERKERPERQEQQRQFDEGTKSARYGTCMPTDEDVARARAWSDRQHEKRSSKTTTAFSSFTEQGKSKYEGLSVFINGRFILALTDTGADGNFVAQHFATSSNMHITKKYSRHDRPMFLMAHGKAIRPVAKASAMCQFVKGDFTQRRLDFFVLQNCIFDVMLGAEFVYSIGLLSFNQHLLTDLPRPQGAVHIRLVKTCGNTRRRLKGVIRHDSDTDWGKSCLAVPDSGAEPNIVSYRYAKECGWLLHMEPNPPSCKLLQFADGSMEETEGLILLYWKFESNSEQSPQKIWSVYPGRPPCSEERNFRKEHGSSFEGPFIFDVLRECPWDILVGQDFLDSTDTFTTKARFFTNADDAEPQGLNPVLWVPNVYSSKPDQPDPESQLIARLTQRRLLEDEEKKKKRRARYLNPRLQLVSSFSASTETNDHNSSTLSAVGDNSIIT